MDPDRLHYHLRLNRTAHTPEREKVFACIAYRGPISVQRLVNELAGTVGKTTVYRTVTLFLKLNVIQEIGSKKYELTDIFAQHRHFFTCRICHERVGFNDTRVEEALTRLTQRRNLALEAHRLELAGLCSRCADTTKSRPAIGTNIRRRPYRL